MIVAAIVLCVLLAGYFLYLYVQAKSYIEDAPKKDMFVCDIHGAMPKDSVMYIDPDGLDVTYGEKPDQTGYIPQCGLCYEDRIRAAKEKYKDIGR